MPDRAETRVSIIITCHNYGAYVAHAIESALAQDHRPLEIIVLDDGSSDDSLEVIRRYEDRVQVIAQANTGQVAATNRAYAQSRGDIVIFLDADDLLRPEAVSTVVAHWHAGCVKAQYELDVIDRHGQGLGRLFCNYAPDYDGAALQREFRRFGSYQWPVTSGNAYARGYLDQLMPLQARGPDGPLNTVAPLYGDVVVIHKVLGSYRLHGKNQSMHGTDASTLGRRFSLRVDRRLGEIAFLQKHAALRGQTLPAGSLLDQDLFMVNYRLMLQKLGEPYQTGEGDTALKVWRAGMRLLKSRSMPLGRKALHAFWLTLLLVSPRWLADGLIRLRFERGELLRRWRSRWAAPARPARSADVGQEGKP